MDGSRTMPDGTRNEGGGLTTGCEAAKRTPNYKLLGRGQEGGLRWVSCC